jgi:uncharacterized lipoprotein YddW (UPF0748 family)
MKLKMKKILSAAIAIMMIVTMFVPAKAAGVQLKIGKQTVNYTGRQVKVKVNKNKLNLENRFGIIIDGYAMVPYKQAFQQSELLVSVSKTGKNITFGYNGNKILVTLNSKTAYVNGNEQTMPAAPKKVTYINSKKSAIVVPARYIAGNLGITYEYNSNNNTVTLTGETNSNVTAEGGMILQYNNKVVSYTGAKTKATLNGTAISSAMPGIIMNGTNMVAANSVFAKSPLKAILKVDKTNNRLLITYGTKTVSMDIGTKKAKVNGVAVTMPEKVLRVKNMKTGKAYYMVPAEFVATNLGLTYKWNNDKITAVMKAKDLDTDSSNKQDSTVSEESNEGKTTILKINDEKLSLPIDPVIKNGTNMVPVRQVFAKSVIGATFKYDSTTKMISLTYGKKTIQMTVGSKTAKVNGKSTTMETAPCRMKNDAGKSYVMVPAHFVASGLEFGYQWNEKKLTANITGSFATPSEPEQDHSDELRGMWISYLEFDNQLLEEAEFQAKVDEMFSRCVELNMNAVFVQVRPFADALYDSKYFPWSSVVAGVQGTDPGYDPLEYMVEKAHLLGLEFHGWVNPYRITAEYTGTAADAVEALSDDNQAKIWYESESEEENRNVLVYQKQLYYNPASSEVRNLITNGIKEIVKNYHVDGIHFDDYFYPTFSTSNVETAFDAVEYDDYVYAGGTDTIAQWRRGNVNTLIAKVYKAIKNIDEECVFGVSPAGNMNNLRSDLQYYVDIDTWMQEDGYVDYICPQIYWGFENGTYSYDNVYDQWTALERRDGIKIYIGIAAYKAGTNSTDEWGNNNDILKRQVEYGRETGGTNGYIFFRYDSFQNASIKKELKNLQTVLK